MNFFEIDYLNATHYKIFSAKDRLVLSIGEAILSKIFLRTNMIKMSVLLFLIHFLLFCPLWFYGQQNNFILTAHRGGAAHAPENSLAAINHALKSNVQRIEVDVRMTKDSVLILMHDKRINRTTNGKGKVKNLTYDEIQKYSLKTRTDTLIENVPTLSEAFEKINKQKELLIEIKKQRSNRSGIEAQIVRFISENNAYAYCKILTFCDKVLYKCHAIDTNLRLSKLFVYKPCLLPLIIDTKIRFKNLKNYYFVEDFSVNKHFATRCLIRKIHKQGKQVHVWTTYTTRKIQKLMKRGVDGIITDVVL